MDPLPSLDVLTKQGTLPNSDIPSDHIPLKVYFRWHDDDVGSSF